MPGIDEKLDEFKRIYNGLDHFLVRPLLFSTFSKFIS
jgi:hypothetical protein